jgi:hypothetical protein
MRHGAGYGVDAIIASDAVAGDVDERFEEGIEPIGCVLGAYTIAASVYFPEVERSLALS